MLRNACATSALACTTLVIDATFYQRVNVGCSACMFRPMIRSRNVQRVFVRLVTLCRSGTTLLGTTHRGLLLLRVLIGLKARCAAPGRRLPASGTPSAMGTTVHFVRRRCGRGLSLSCLTRGVCIGGFILSHTFQQCANGAMMRCVGYCHYKRTTTLVATNDHMDRTTLGYKFSGLSFFAGAFGRRVNMLPSALGGGVWVPTYTRIYTDQFNVLCSILAIPVGK